MESSAVREDLVSKQACGNLETELAEPEKVSNVPPFAKCLVLVHIAQSIQHSSEAPPEPQACAQNLKMKFNQAGIVFKSDVGTYRIP